MIYTQTQTHTDRKRLEVPNPVSDAELSRALAEGVEGLDLAWHLRRTESDDL
jgi:hypothetical protein